MMHSIAIIAINIIITTAPKRAQMSPIQRLVDFLTVY